MKKPLYTVLYVQVLAVIVIGVLLVFFFSEIGASMKPLGDGFIKLNELPRTHVRSFMGACSHF